MKYFVTAEFYQDLNLINCPPVFLINSVKESPKLTTQHKKEKTMKNTTKKANMTVNSLILSALASVSLSANAEIVDTIEKTYNFAKDGKIQLANVNGDVKFTACNCDQVTLVAEIKASSQEMRDRITVKIDSSENKLKIKTKYKNNKGSSWNNERSEVNYTLEVPNTVNLDSIRLVNGDLDISGVSGQLDADLVNGELNSDGLSSTTRVNMVNGDVQLKFSDLTNADSVKLNSVNGKIEVFLPASADVSVTAETVSGKISNEFGLEVIKHRYVGSEMKGNIGSGRVSLDMENVNGKISLKSM